MRSENCLRIFSAQGESTKQRETKGGDQSKAVTNILISLFSEIISVQHKIKIIRGNYVSVQ